MTKKNNRKDNRSLSGTVSNTQRMIDQVEDNRVFQAPLSSKMIDLGNFNTDGDLPQIE
jgi:hypothetical protein